jgi:hypothetical protein
LPARQLAWSLQLGSWQQRLGSQRHSPSSLQLSAREPQLALTLASRSHLRRLQAMRSTLELKGQVPQPDAAADAVKAVPIAQTTIPADLVSP